MKRAKHKPKTHMGEREESSVNVPLFLLLLVILAVGGVVLYVLVLPYFIEPREKIVIVPYASATPVPPTLTPTVGQPTVGLPTPSPAPTLTPQGVGTRAPISLATALQVELLTKLVGHANPISSVAFSPDGKLLASADRGGLIILWDAVSLVEVRQVHSDSNTVSSLAFSPDSRLLAAGGNDTLVRLWDVPTGQALPPLDGPTGPVNSVAFSPEEALLAAGSDDGRVYLWNTGSGSLVATLVGHTSYVSCVAFNTSDGSILAAGGEDDTVRLWKVPGGAELGVLEGHTNNVVGLAFSPDGARLASVGADNTIRVWQYDADSRTWTEEYQISGHTENVNSAVFSPDGSLIVSVGAGLQDNTLRLWDASDGSQLRILFPVNEGAFTSVAFRPDGALLATGGTTFLALWAAPLGVQVQIDTPLLSPTPPLSDGGPAAGEAVPTAPAEASTEEASDQGGEETDCQLTTRFDEVNLRAGPGTDFDLLDTLAIDTTVSADGWAQGEEGFVWWRLADDEGWARGDLFVEIPEACFGLPQVTP